MNEKKQAHILIVDDTPENIQVLGSLLREEDYILSVAYHGQEALERLKYINPDLILLDIMMPILDGFKTCERIKSSHKHNDIPIIFLSAKNEISDISKGLQLGAVDYITKPFNKDELLLRVKNHLDLSLSKKIIEQQNNERKELLHILCHDLTNPLSAVVTYIKLIQKNPSLIHELESKLLPIVESGIDIIDMIRKMRTLEDKKDKLKLEPTNLKEAIDFSISIMRNKIDNKNIDIIINISDNIFILAEKTTLINTVINNLLSNSIKFSNINSKIVFSVQELDTKVRLIIEDFGIGIPEPIMENMFNLMYSNSRPGTLGERGTGYGLPLVKKFINYYNAEITLESKAIEDYPNEHGTKTIITFQKAN